MILYKNNTSLINTKFPDTDFIGNADYVIPDNSELANKIRSMITGFNIIEDDSGNIIDVTPITYAATEEQLNRRKTERISESKELLRAWLSSNPYIYSDGCKYSCTEEKQSLLNSNLASYERAVSAGIDYPLKWNSSGCECIPWDYDELRNLSLCIAAYVAPKVSKQQSLEIKIKSCTTLEEINSVEICYDD